MPEDAERSEAYPQRWEAEVVLSDGGTMAVRPIRPDDAERIVAFHERQDARYATEAARISDETGKPILLATELAVADPDNAAPAAVRATGRLCYPSANRAVTALEHAWRRARWLAARGLT